MKKLIVLLGAVAIVAGCNNNDDADKTASDQGSVYRESAGAGTSASEMSLTNSSSISTNSSSTNSSDTNQPAPEASNSKAESTPEPAAPNSTEAK